VKSVKVYDDPTQPICVAPGEVFGIAIAGNPTTGYLWLPKVDSDSIVLVGQEYETDSSAVGAACREVFCLRAKATGEIAIAFEHRRPWEASALDTMNFQIVIE
jgi:predicted secreted protein